MRPRSVTAPLRVLGLAMALCLGVALPGPASAQPRPLATATPIGSVQAGASVVAPDSPRASVERYLELCRAGEYADAAAYLDVAEARRADAPALARRLKAVLDRQIWVNVDDLSPLPFGKTTDKLPTGVEEIGKIPGTLGMDPVRIVRKAFPEGVRWVFTRTTVEHIDGWFSRLHDKWMEEHLPEPLLRTGPRALAYWQWIAVPLLFLVALLAGHIMGWATRRVLRRVMSKPGGAWDDRTLARLGAPLTLGWGLSAVWFALPRLELYPPAQELILHILHAGALVAIFWMVVRLVEVGGQRLLDRERDNAAALSVVPLGTKALKTAVVAVAAVVILSALGFQVGSLIAGLGIGGVAVALAAQKTVEHLFGSFSIGVDQPFRVGEYITVDGVSGTVEAIGLRSTRLRTLERTLITIPNGKLAEMRIESYARRDRIKLAVTLPLERSTPPAAVRAALAGVRELLAKHSEVASDATVALASIGVHSLDVEILAWVKTTSWNDFLPVREELLLALLDVVQESGAKLAYPTRTIEVRTP